MKVAIFHYHLNRGGVTQVIANQLQALDAVSDSEPVEVFLFFGGRKADWPEQITGESQNTSADVRHVGTIGLCRDLPTNSDGQRHG